MEASVPAIAVAVDQWLTEVLATRCVTESDPLVSAIADPGGANSIHTPKGTCVTNDGLENAT